MIKTEVKNGLPEGEDELREEGDDKKRERNKNKGYEKRRGYKD